MKHYLMNALGIVMLTGYLLFCFVAAVAPTVLLFWAVIELVTWVTSK